MNQTDNCTITYWKENHLIDLKEVLEKFKIFASKGVLFKVPVKFTLHSFPYLLGCNSQGEMKIMIDYQDLAYQNMQVMNQHQSAGSFAARPARRKVLPYRLQTLARNQGGSNQHLYRMVLRETSSQYEVPYSQWMANELAWNLPDSNFSSYNSHPFPYNSLLHVDASISNRLVQPNGVNEPFSNTLLPGMPFERGYCNTMQSSMMNHTLYQQTGESSWSEMTPPVLGPTHGEPLQSTNRLAGLVPVLSPYNDNFPPSVEGNENVANVFKSDYNTFGPITGFSYSTNTNMHPAPMNTASVVKKEYFEPSTARGGV